MHEDITRRLAELEIDAPAAPDVQADVRRGRVALRRRRARRTVTAAAPATCLAVVVAIALQGSPGTPAPTVIERGDAVADTVQVKLVAYRGPQKDGFRIASIPEGFDLRAQDSSALHLVLARRGDTTSSDVYVDKLVVFLRSVSDRGSPGTPVKVNGQPGGIRSDDASRTITFKVGDVWVQAQCWNTVGLTEQQLVTFAEGIQVEGNPSVTRG